MTRTLCAAALVCAAFANTAEAAPVTAYGWFPLEEGNTWVYASDNQGYLVDTQVEVISSSDEAYLGNGWYVNYVDGLFADGWDMYDRTNQSEMWLYNNGWQHVFDFDAATGDSWTANAGACDTYNVSARNGDTATTPAGVFTNVKAYAFDRITDPTVRCGAAGLGQVRFAEGIGPVDYTKDGRKAHLLYARTNGTVVAAGPHETRTLDGLETSMVLTSDALTQPHGVQCITWPCPQPLVEVGVAFTVTNVSGATKTLTFGNGQKFEIDLFDGEGAHILSWSDDKFFTQAVETLTLEAGQTEVFYGTLDLGVDGSQITGDFQAVGYLKAPNSGKLAVDLNVAPAQ
ncbi:MAG: hypothetical protein EP330_08000 [Deltaproteobacteria bacterium]|nr:MAG: hypothetical protein EP330_08000 [Deltaproteobacteria bacterium]